MMGLVLYILLKSWSRDLLLLIIIDSGLAQRAARNETGFYVQNLRRNLNLVLRLQSFSIVSKTDSFYQLNLGSFLYVSTVSFLSILCNNLRLLFYALKWYWFKEILIEKLTSINIFGVMCVLKRHFWWKSDKNVDEY